ncbi:MAG: hypothetical protein ABF506_08405 [Zymomonas mobilis]|uniref:hypothetical protein n=1 Tax=Zymomonas mobilis TaxID=542 RepID=UPI0039E92C96
MAADPAWIGDRLRSEIDKNETERVRLKQPVAVFLFYWTAFGNGENAPLKPLYDVGTDISSLLRRIRLTAKSNLK